MLIELQRKARSWFPTKWIAVLLVIGLVDLITTAVLHANGLIVEMNPVMKPVIEESEWLFVMVKGMTLALGWLMFQKHYRQNPRFVERACMLGSIAYASVWIVWFTAGSH